MGRWLAVLSELRFDPVTAPVLFVRATEPYTQDDQDSGRWLATPFEPAHTLRSVRSDHFAMVGSDADQTSRVIQEWLEKTL